MKPITYTNALGSVVKLVTVEKIATGLHRIMLLLWGCNAADLENVLFHLTKVEAVTVPGVLYKSNPIEGGLSAVVFTGEIQSVHRCLTAIKFSADWTQEEELVNRARCFLKRIPGWIAFTKRCYDRLEGDNKSVNQALITSADQFCPGWRVMG